MKIHNMAIILVIIVLPITLILSAFTKNQIDTISVQTIYATKLRDATYDAVSAFEINTEDNSYSTVSDSMRRDVNAAVQTFITSLSKNLGMTATTEASIRPYIPAIIFTLYDGYYIYSPAYSFDNEKISNIASTDDGTYSSTAGQWKDRKDENGNVMKDKDGNALRVFEINKDITTDDLATAVNEDTSSVAKFDHVLKPYIYYTVRYIKGDIDVVINYSLDNYIVVYGTIAGKYYTKSGYLVNPNEYSNQKVRETENGMLKRNLPKSTIIFTNKANRSMINDIRVTGIQVEEFDLTNDLMLEDRLTNATEIDGSKMTKWYVEPKTDDYYIDPQSANKYYNGGLDVKNRIELEGAIKFTNEIIRDLGSLTPSDARKLDGQKYEEDEFKDTKTLIFSISDTNDPSDIASPFNEHKRKAIQLSIQDNLAQAIANYNQNSEALRTTYNFKVPKFSETEWDKVLTNVSMITIMQGIQAGTKMYNDYAIITSTSNKEFISGDSLYFVNYSQTNPKYHKIGCKYLDDDNSSESQIVGYVNSEFDRKSYEDIQTDESGKNINKNYYYHNNEACYYCIVNSMPEGKEVDWKNNDERKRAYYTALAREKYNFYKTNDYLDKDEKIDSVLPTPADTVNVDTYEVVATDDIKPSVGGSAIKGRLYLPNSNEKKWPLVIISNGYGQTVKTETDTNNDIIQNAIYFAQNGIAAYVYDYRGTGSSDPNVTVTENSMIADLRQVIQSLKSSATAFNINTKNVFLYGADVGGVISAKVAGTLGSSTIRGICIEAPTFKNAADIPIYKGKIKLFRKDQDTVVSNDIIQSIINKWHLTEEDVKVVEGSHTYTNTPVIRLSAEFINANKTTIQ